jgi:hypothetical protein
MPPAEPYFTKSNPSTPVLANLLFLGPLHVIYSICSAPLRLRYPARDSKYPHVLLTPFA